MQKIKFVGTIDHVFFKKDDFVIATMKVQKLLDGAIKYNNYGEVVFKGEMTMLPEHSYIITGGFVNDDRYGPQYKLIESRLKNPIETMSIEDFRRFLLSISPKYGFLINKEYPDPRKLFKDEDIDALTKVKGIGPKVATRLIQKYNSQKDYGPAYAAFGKWGFTHNRIRKIINHFSSMEKAIEIFNRNPYELIGVTSIGFKTIDEKALENGVPENDHNRVQAYLKDYFEQLAQSGSSYTTVVELKNHLRENIYNCDLEQTFREINEHDDFIVYEIDGKKLISLRHYYAVEAKVANELIRLRDSETNIKLSSKKDEISKIEEEQGWKYSEEQHKAISKLLKENVVLLRGCGGVGKTSTLNAVIKTLLSSNYTVATCALAGKAADNLTQLTGIKGRTIHRLLGLGMTENSDNSPIELSYDVIVVDEISMVNIDLFLKLISSLRDGTKLIMVGDDAQLDSIGIGVMKEILGSKMIPTVTLRKIHRQAKESAIITHSLSFRTGRIPEELSEHSSWHMLGKKKDLGYVLEDGGRESIDTILDSKRVFKYALKKYDVKDIQIITQTTANCFKLNKMAQQIANPVSDSRKSITMFKGKDYEYSLREGDKVINTANNYNSTEADTGNPMPIYNGNTGIIEKINIEKEDDEKYVEVIVNFDGIGKVRLGGADINRIQLGYAITVHKSQGSTIPCVIVCLPFHYTLNSRELLYTAITRASKVCYLVTSLKTLRRTVKKTSAVVSRSNLGYFLQKEGDAIGF